MDLLLDFINTKEWDATTLRAFYKRHEISSKYKYANLVKDGHNIFCFTTSNDKNIYSLFYENEIQKRTQEKACESFYLGFRGKPKIIFPSDEKYCKLIHEIKNFQNTLNIFIDNCIRGNLDLNFINKYIEWQEFRFSLVETDTPWKPGLKDNEQGDYTAIDLYIVVNEIFYPVIGGDGNIFSRLRRCKNCNKVFTPKSLKGMYCSTKCKSTFHYIDQRQANA